MSTPEPDFAAMRAEAVATLNAHNPEHQADNPYERCALCHYTRHPCDAYAMAKFVLTILDAHQR